MEESIGVELLVMGAAPAALEQFQRSSERDDVGGRRVLRGERGDRGLDQPSCGDQLERASSGTPLVIFEAWARDRRLAGNLVWVLALILAYVLLSERIGFIPLSIGILVVLFTRLAVPLGRAVVIAVVTTAVIYVAFGRLLRVALPRGLLEGIIW